MSERFSQRRTDAPSLDDDVETRLLYAAYARKPLNLLMTVGAMVVIAGLFWHLFPARQMTLWMLAILTGAALGYLECVAFKRAAPPPQAIAPWQKLFLAQATLAGATWALGPCLMIPRASGAEVTLFVVLLLAVCTVAMISVAEQRAAMLAFVCAVTAPPAFVLWNEGAEVERLVATTLFVGMVLMIFVGHRLNRTMRELLQNEGRTNAILASALDAIIEIDAEGRITDWNRRADAVFGWHKEEVLGLALEEMVIAQQHRDAFRRELDGFAANGAEQVLDHRAERTALRKDGTEFPTEMSVTPLRNGAAWHFTVFIADISARKQSELDLTATNQRLSALIEAIPDAIFLKDAETRWLVTNESAKQLFRLHSIDWRSKTEMELAALQPEFQDAHNACLVGDEKAWQAGRLTLFSETVIGEDGKPHDFEVRKMPLFDEQGRRQALLTIGRDVTERKQAEETLKENREKYQALSAATSEAIFISEQGRCLEQNARAEELFGYSTEEALGRFDTDWIAPQDRDRVVKNMLDGYELPYEVTGLRKDGSTFPALLHGKMMHYKGRVVRVTTMGDITERKQAEQAQRIAATAFESQQGMMITNAQRVIVRVNLAFTEITGYGADEVVGCNPRLLASGRHEAAFFAALWEAVARDGSWQGEVWNRRKNGEVFPAWLSISAVTDEAGRTSHYVGAFTDISLHKTAEDQIRNLAFFDPLTGLANRRLLMDRLEQALVSSARHQRKGALLFIDLDNFKTLNDTLGHFQGDLLLEQVARRLSNCIREGDTVARLGGDEFVVILEDLSKNEREAASQAETVGEKILLALRQPYQLDNGEHHSTSSVGITLLRSQQQGSIDEPLKRAELAMYQAKTAGRNTLRFFDPKMQAEVTARAALEADLREAILKDQFVLYYQPQVVGESRLTGVEALVRWRHPERGLVPPAEFIPLAEDTGLILPLGRWVLETACGQLALWAARPEMAHLTVAVNVSARQFHHQDFVEDVLATLERSGANPRRLKLELTESLLVDDVEGIIAKMNSLKARGVGFSLDDFGTGYSSLSYLKRMPLDQLKIDQGFVRNILTDPNDAAIAKMIIVLAESLSLIVIAEGVEIEAQRNFLAHQGCHAYQGYLFSRPLPIDDFEAFARAATLPA